MTKIYDAVVDAISEISGIDPATISPDKHILDDLGVDSLDFLDVTFEIDRLFDIKLPIEEWLASSDSDGAVGRQALIMSRFVEFVEETIEQKAPA